MVRLDRGVFMLTLDFELAWGTAWRAGYRQYYHSLVKTRMIVDRLLLLLETYQISATWATVGHLFLDSCTAVDGVKHPEMPRPHYPCMRTEWYSWDPATNIDDAPLWYGRDMIDRLQAARPAQEIGCHTFSHIVMSDECAPEVVEAELARCRELAEARGIRLESFVFPRNIEGHHDLLSRHGFRTYRAQPPRPFRNRRLSGAVEVLRDFLALPPGCWPPEWNATSRLWYTYGSMVFRGADGFRGLIPTANRTRRACQGLRIAVAQRTVFHLYFHPFNLGVRTEALLDSLDRVLSHAAELRARQQLDILSMGALAAMLSARIEPVA
jgi:peptidoglycan/xylan/chitin deacetylase (PgdA/CDA1 family)